MESSGNKYEYCGKEFKRRKNLYEHVRNIHKAEPHLLCEKAKNLKCFYWESCYSNYNNFKNQLIISHNKEIFKEVAKFNNKGI